MIMISIFMIMTMIMMISRLAGDERSWPCKPLRCVIYIHVYIYIYIYILVSYTILYYYFILYIYIERERDYVRLLLLLSLLGLWAPSTWRWTAPL